MAAKLVESEPVDILIAEDDVGVRGALRLALEQQGYCCSEAQDGQAAIDLARRNPPRCAILDLAMPVLDGFAVARALRADARTRGIPIHGLTGRSDQSAIPEASMAGINICLMKPVDSAYLLRLIDMELKHPRLIQVSGLTLSQARDQLDWWESTGCSGLEATYADESGFTVRCVRPPICLPGDQAGVRGREKS